MNLSDLPADVAAARPAWVRRLSFFIADEIIDDDWNDADDVTLDLIEDAVNEILCNTYGHEVIDDMCGIPEHRYCVHCQRRESAL